MLEEGEIDNDAPSPAHKAAAWAPPPPVGAAIPYLDTSVPPPGFPLPPGPTAAVPPPNLYNGAPMPLTFPPIVPPAIPPPVPILNPNLIEAGPRPSSGYLGSSGQGDSYGNSSRDDYNYRREDRYVTIYLYIDTYLKDFIDKLQSRDKSCDQYLDPFIFV